jgi:hypothetical protein
MFSTLVVSIADEFLINTKSLELKKVYGDDINNFKQTL